MNYLRDELTNEASEYTGNVGGGGGLETAAASIAVDATLYKEWAPGWA